MGEIYRDDHSGACHRFFLLLYFSIFLHGFITNTFIARIDMEEMLHICKPNPLSAIIRNEFAARTTY